MTEGPARAGPRRPDRTRRGARCRPSRRGRVAMPEWQITRRVPAGKHDRAVLERATVEQEGVVGQPERRRRTGPSARTGRRRSAFSARCAVRARAIVSGVGRSPPASAQAAASSMRGRRRQAGARPAGRRRAGRGSRGSAGRPRPSPRPSRRGSRSSDRAGRRGRRGRTPSIEPSDARVTWTRRSSVGTSAMVMPRSIAAGRTKPSL